MKKISLFVMTEKGYEVLKRIVALNKELVESVVIGRDSQVDNDFSNEISYFCQSCNIEYFLRGDEPEANADNYIIAVSWRWMINHPSEKIIVFHDSLLPKYRGFAPLVNMLINGEEIIGVSAIFGTSEYDRGDVIGQRSTRITYPIKIAQAVKINNENFLDLTEYIVERLSVSKELESTPQVERDATYSIWRDSDDYFIDWNADSNTIKRLIDAVGRPYMGARTRTSKGELVIIDDAEMVDDVHCELRHVGKIIFINEGMPVVICGKGLLKITKASICSDSGKKDFVPIKRFRVKLE